jgi:hypothetical protein
MSAKAFVLIAALLAVSTVAVAQDDPIMGTWKVNTAKTKLPPGESAEALTRVHEPLPNGIKITRPLTDANGNPTRGTWTLYFDGKDHPVHGDANLDTLSLRRVDRYTMEAVAKKDGQIHNRMRWDISPDGKSMTWTSNRVLPPNRAGTTVRVYDKQ